MITNIEIFKEIEAERERAHTKHGSTSMRGLPPLDHRRNTVLGEEVGEVAEALNDYEHHKFGPGESEYIVSLRQELIQVAAMAVEWIIALNPYPKLIGYEEAREALGRCGFDIDEGRTVVHCFSGGMGADWDLLDALELAQSASLDPDAKGCAWIDHMIGGICLAIDDGKRVRVFDTVHPA